MNAERYKDRNLIFSLSSSYRATFHSLIFYKEFKETPLLSHLLLRPGKAWSSQHKQHFAVSKQVRRQGAGSPQV